VLLRERFHLQQCIRYLAARCDDPLHLHSAAAGDAGAASRRPGSAAAGAPGAAAAATAARLIQPASLAGSVLYSSPLSARSLSLSGRGKLADRGTVYTTKVCVWVGGGCRVPLDGGCCCRMEPGAGMC
jgi:hypothetical protein